MKRKAVAVTYTVGLLLFLVSFLPLIRAADCQRPLTDISSLFVTPERKAVVENAEVIEVSLLSPKNPKDVLPAFELSGYIRVESVFLTKESRKQIVELLLDDSTYKWDEVQPDGSFLRSVLVGWYGYHVRLTVRKGDKSIGFGISCFAMMTIWENEVAVNEVRLGKRNSELYRIFRRLFPNDMRLSQLEHFDR